MGLVPNPEFRGINTKSLKFSGCLNYHAQKFGVAFLNIWQVLSLSYWNGWAKLVLHRVIQEFRAMGIMCMPYFRSWNFLQSSWDGKRRSYKFHPTFEIGSNTWWVDGLLIKSFLKEGSNPRFHPSLRDFANNTNVGREGIFAYEHILICPTWNPDPL